MFLLFVTSQRQENARPVSPDGRFYDLAEVEAPQIGWRNHLLGRGQLETGLRCKLRAALQALLQTLP